MASRMHDIALRIPLKWGTDSGEVGQRRSEATLVTAMISEVPHLSQEFCGRRGKQHHFVSIISFLVRCSFRSKGGTIPLGSGAGFRDMWGAIPLKWGNLVGCPIDSCQIISGDDGSGGPASVAVAEFRVCNQRFSISSILRRTCSQ